MIINTLKKQVLFGALLSSIIFSTADAKPERPSLQKIDKAIAELFRLIRADFEFLRKLRCRQDILESYFILSKPNLQFVRAITNVKNPQGELALGSLLAEPIRSTLLAGKVFTGLSIINGITYFGRYIPLKNRHGSVYGSIGAVVPVIPA